MPRRHSAKKHTLYEGQVASCSEKKRYKSADEITKAIELIELERPEVKISSYQCPYCAGWHLTSRQNTT